MTPRNRLPFPWLRMLAAGLCVLAASASEARTILAEGYALRVWQTEDGLPQNMVTSAVQTRDGYLWFGTYGGLARFDGERFRVFDSANTPGLQDRRISFLFEDADGVLWIGHESGVITRFANDRFETFATSSGAAGEKIIGLGTDRRNHLWAMRANGGLDRVSPAGPGAASLIAPALPSVMAWTRGDSGDIWVAENGRAAVLREGALNAIDLGPPVDGNYVLCIAASQRERGGNWILSRNRARRWADGAWVEDRGAFPWPDGPIACALELRDGTLAVGTIYSGLYLVFGDGRPAVHFDGRNGMPQNWIRFLHEDREGNLWVGTGSAGVVSLHRSAFSVLNAPDRWQNCTVLAVAPGAGGALWVGTDGASLYHYAQDTWTRFGEGEGLANAYIPAVTETSTGDVWVGHFWWGSPFRLEAGRFVRPPFLDDKSAPVFALLASGDGRELLVGNRDGLLRVTSSGAEPVFQPREGTAGAACALARDAVGGIWCGFEEGGLVHLANGAVRHYGRAEGLASESIRSLHLDTQGTLWVGTADGGLCRYKNGRFATLGAEQGIVDRFIGCILEDSAGNLWLSSHHGLQRVRREDLDRCADGLISTVGGQIYDNHDGLPTIEFTGGLQAAGCVDAQGRLWFANSKGLLAVDPARIETNPLSPPVVLDSILLDGRPLPTGSGAVAAHLSPDHERLEFRFSGLSFVAPNKVRFKYRLEGIDKDWVDAGARRNAFYSQLPAGEYRFRVIACNNDGVWNREGTTLAFHVAPFFWQTWWFVGSASLAAAGLLASLVRTITRRRMQRRMDELQRQHALERERARIAQDIHDDVGASLARIAMLSQPARSDLAEPDRAAAVLARIYATAREVTRALDEIVWAVDPTHDTLDSLVSYMGRYAQDFLTAAGLRCRLDYPIDLPAWRITAETRHNLFLAFKEALNNTARHSGANEVRVSLRLHDSSFVLAIRDNGRGLPATIQPSTEHGRLSSGRGLENMRRRLASISGTCEVSSEPDSGTTVAFTVTVPERGPAV